MIGCGDEPSGPLAAAAETGDRPTLVRLLAEGADPNPIDGGGKTPLIRAVQRGHVRLVSPLISRGADPDLRDGGSTGWTPLMHAIHVREVDVVRALLNSGADPNAASTEGLTPLMMAAGYGFDRVVELLIERGADPLAESPDGETALSRAVRGVADLDHLTIGACQTDTVRVLAEAAPDLRLADGSWALGWARLKRCKEILELVGP